MPNIIPCRLWNNRFVPDAALAPEIAEACTEAQRRQVLAYPDRVLTHYDESTPASPGEDKPERVRQFPEPHRWTPFDVEL